MLCILQPIVDQIAENCFKVATDRSGCCVLQACVEHSRGDVRNRLLAAVMANAIPIAEDPFGFVSLISSLQVFSYT